MELLLSWLADAVDLAAELPLEADAAGRRRLTRLDDEARAAARALADRLTACGLAVESIRELTADAGGPDLVLDVEITSNRPDAMCHRGLARELAAALGRPLAPLAPPHYGSLTTHGATGPVVLEDPQGCPRYVARIVRGVKVGPSPEWLRRRLEAIGLRSINNVVDATNYVLWETGQPLHAFDLAKIPGGQIRVRRARTGETLTTLDGKERELGPEILVIADRERAVGLAGIMGGADTEVSESTTDVLLESAHFDRRRVRIGAAALGLHTDASHRFERGADFGICDEASRLCCALFVELAGGTVVDGAVDAVAARPAPTRWRIAEERLNRFVGFGIGGAEVAAILDGLGFAPVADGEGAWRGTVPSWRAADFEPRREGEEAGSAAYAQDLYEEVLRLVGLDRVPATLPGVGGVDAGGSEAHERAGRARDRLAALGYAEAIHYAFQEEVADARYPRLAGEGAPVALANPLSERYAVLRRSLVPNLVAAAEFNANRGATRVALFEVGHLFPSRDQEELAAVALVLGGGEEAAWERRSVPDLFEIKGACESLIEALGGEPPAARAAELPGVAPGSGAELLDAAGATIGWMGRIAACDTPFPLFAAELLPGRVSRAAGARPVVPPPRLPGIDVDLTLTHALALDWSALAAAIDAAGEPLLVGYRLKDRYRGAGVPAGAVATTITFHYHGGERSLTQDEVNERHAALSAKLEAEFAVAREEAR